MSLHRKKHNYPCLQLHSGSGKKVSMLLLLLQLQIRSLTQGFFAPLKRSTKRELRQSLL